MDAGQRLKAAAATYEKKQKEYGSTYRNYGRVLKELFPEGIHVETEQDMCRLGTLQMIVHKLMRYCNNFNEAGHDDSIHDLGVYAFILEELDNDE